MRALFDVNALLALFDRDHVFHTSVRAWWAANEGSGWATCPITQNGFARIMSQPGYPRNRPTVEAIKALHAGVVQPGHQFWPDDISIADADVFDRTRILRPKQLTDVYLLALAVKNGGRLVTLDRAVPISAVHGAEPHHIAVL